MSIWLIIYLAVAAAILAWTWFDVRREPLASKVLVMLLGIGSALTWPLLVMGVALLLIFWLLSDIWSALR